MPPTMSAKNSGEFLMKKLPSCFALLVILQAIPWYSAFTIAGEWKPVDVQSAYLWFIPSSLLTILLTRWILGAGKPIEMYLIWITGTSLATQGLSQILGGLFAVSSQSAPSFIGLQWLFQSLPLFLSGLLLLRLGARRSEDLK